MGEKEYKRKAELMFQKNTILINQLERAKEIIREYIRLSLQEDKDIDANVKLFQKAEDFLKE